MSANEWGAEVCDIHQVIGVTPGANPNDPPRVQIGPMQLANALRERSVALFIPFRYEIFSDSIADFVFPEHVDLVFMPGATLFVPTGMTVHIHGRVEAADIPVFCTPGQMATGGIVLASAMGGTVRLLSPRQRFVNLRWFGAMATAEGNEQHARYYNSDFALQAALDCASVNRVKTRDETARRVAA